MNKIVDKLNKTIHHIEALHETFTNEDNFPPLDHQEYINYQENLDRLARHLEALDYENKLYPIKGRQMVLSDFFEYVFFGRIYYSLKKEVAERSHFISAILSFVNLLMCYETITVSPIIRARFLENLANKVPGINEEEYFNEVHDFQGRIGLPQSETEGTKELNKYFDTLLPKTAGGLWHELLVYVFLLRNDCGYIIPLLLSQRLIGLRDYIIPPDFLLLSKDKRLYGIEVGIGKEVIQSSNFVLRTAIPTATVDTLNSRTDRCPICKKWIEFCPYVIDAYSNLDLRINKAVVKCYEVCTYYNQDEIFSGTCPYTKYRRFKNQQAHTDHPFSNGYHFHYQCVLEHVGEGKKAEIIAERDRTAIRTHFPFYAGLEGLLTFAPELEDDDD
jgi:hypothetical protein